MKNYIFVYGTLKKGFSNNDAITKNKGKYIGDAKLYTHEFILLSGFYYPFIRKITNITMYNLMKLGWGLTIHGELYEGTEETLRSTDRLEGYPYHYNRITQAVSCEGRAYPAWVYYQEELSLVGQDVCMDGVWSREGKNILTLTKEIVYGKPE